MGPSINAACRAYSFRIAGMLIYGIPEFTSTNNVEEYDFFNELCGVALATDKKVRFAGVMDDEGKLIAGKYRKDVKSPMFKSSSAPDEQNNLFYASYRSVMQARSFEPHLGQLKYQLSEFQNVRLVTVPLTVRQDKFLCVSLDLSETCDKTIARLLESI